MKESSGSQSEKTGGSAAKKGLRGFVTALLIVAFIAGCGFAYWKITTKPPEGQTDISPDANDDAPTYKLERYYTILVVGDDQKGGNTDTIMLVRYDTQEMKVNVLSIPRDTLVNSPLANKKINAVYHNLGGMDALMEEVSELTGYRPNNYMLVDTEVFTKVVDAMGGVDFYVPFDMDYDDYHDENNDGVIDYVFTIHVEEGQQTLSGYDALGVFRWRQNNNGAGHVYMNPDIERIDMQHDLLMAIAEKAMNTKNVLTLMNIAKAVIDQCETDLSLGNIQWYFEEFLKMSMDNIDFFTMPTNGAWIYKTAYVTIEVDPWLQMLNESFNVLDRGLTREDVGILYVGRQIDLKNGQLYVEPDDLACTNGTEIDKNFLKNSN
ncbi:MAG: LCP family protein [Clostridiales bacterium]|nr:LCP family protein [Clostridiales bacterium]